MEPFDRRCHLLTFSVCGSFARHSSIILKGRAKVGPFWGCLVTVVQLPCAPDLYPTGAPKILTGTDHWGKMTYCGVQE
jgi:hypothetical protein